MFIMYSHIFDLTYKHIVPTGLKRVLKTFIYKHIVPTGLKSVQRNRNTVKTICLCETMLNKKLFSITRYLEAAQRFGPGPG